MDKPQNIVHLSFDRVATFIKKSIPTDLNDYPILTYMLSAKGTLDSLWNKMLARRKEIEDSRETVLTPHKTDRFECQEDTVNFVPSSVYAIRFEQNSRPEVYVFQDPDYLNDFDPFKYIIFARYAPISDFIRKLCAHFDIKITGVYSDQLLLRANKGCASNDEFSVLEGKLRLNFFFKDNSLLNVIEAIQQCTGQNVALQEIIIYSPCPEQITKTVRLSPKVKSLAVDAGVPSAVIQHLSRELYGHDEMRSPNSEIQSDLNIKGSSLEVLKIWDNFGTTELSFNDFNCLVRPARLTHLRNLIIPTNYLDHFLGILDLDNHSLEEMTIGFDPSGMMLLELPDDTFLQTLRYHHIAQAASEAAELIEESTIRKEQKEPTGLCGADFRKTRGKLVNLRLLSIMHVLPKSLEQLLGYRSPSLKELQLHFNSLSETDLKLVSEILGKVSVQLAELKICGHFLSGNLVNIFGSLDQQRSTFHCLRELIFGRADLKSEDIEALAEVVQCGAFPILCRLRLKDFMLSLPYETLERLVSSCVNYYKESTITIECDFISDELKHKLSRICYNSNVRVVRK